jgi:hypothetical protein
MEIKLKMEQDNNKDGEAEEDDGAEAYDFF